MPDTSVSSCQRFRHFPQPQSLDNLVSGIPNAKNRSVIQKDPEFTSSSRMNASDIQQHQFDACGPTPSWNHLRVSIDFKKWT
jgi:hypothetical protein